MDDGRAVQQATLGDKELRLALVCYGGVSLAVYMHGVTTELQRLVIASTVFCERPSATNPFPPDSTERVYWTALRAIADKEGGLALRVVVDVIAGTSAGGINGIVLAKALARGLQQDPLRRVWFDKASLFKLLRAPVSFRRREPWLRAPLEGRRMSRWAHAALQEMNRTPICGPAETLRLIPPGNELDLFVTTTDCTGFPRSIDLHDPEVVSDLEYRHLLHFHYDPEPSSRDNATFGPQDDGVLTLAVRSTSSFPGAFPPVTLDEVERVAGPLDKDELSSHFTAYISDQVDLKASFFLDGGVLNNRPFDHAVHAIMERAADRQVDRRLLFIEPDPVDATVDRTTAPSWFHTVRAALTSIPSHQPIADALTELARHNLRAIEIRQLIALSEPRVLALIEAVAAQDGNPLSPTALAPVDCDTIERWADTLRDQAEDRSDASYAAYQAIKMGEVLADLATGLCLLFGYPATSRHAALVHRMVRRWGMSRNHLLDDRRPHDKDALAAYNANAAARRTFLETFDLNFRRRRLRFLIRCINDAYPGVQATDPALRPKLDAAKQRLYRLIRLLRDVQSGRWIPEEQPALYDDLARLFGPQALAPLLGEATGGVDAAVAGSIEPSSRAARRMDERLDRHLTAQESALRTCFGQLRAEIRVRLDHVRMERRSTLAWLQQESGLPEDLLRRMLARYIGYDHWDAVFYPLIAMSGITEPDPVEVIRMSPNDATALTSADVRKRLDGVAAFHFGAFLKPSSRENDYLWGRLDGVERLLKVLGDVGAQRTAKAPAFPDTLVWQGFRAVLDTEMPGMRRHKSRAVAAGLKAKVDARLG